MNTQTIVALIIVVFAGAWAVRLLVFPFIASLKPPKKGACSGGCGCGHEDQPNTASPKSEAHHSK